MKSTNALIIAGALLVIGGVNAWVLHRGITDFNESFRYKAFKPDDLEMNDLPPTLTVLSNNVVVTANARGMNSYRIDDKGNLIWQSSAYPGNTESRTREDVLQR